MISAIILAGGRGKRMNSSVSKQYININEKPMLYYTIKAFMQNENIDNIVLVVPEDEIDYCTKNVVDKYCLNVDNIVSGGKERSDSVYNGLKSLKDTDTSVVLIHDGARPFVSEKIINLAIYYAEKYKASAPGIMPKDTIKIKDGDNFSKKTLQRNKLVCVQTPQAFDYNLIYKCHSDIRNENIDITDDTMVAEYYGNKVYLFDGEYTNIKITTTEDLVLGEHLAKAANK